MDKTPVKGGRWSDGGLVRNGIGKRKENPEPLWTEVLEGGSRASGAEGIARAQGGELTVAS